jgi:hypothetical protein
MSVRVAMLLACYMMPLRLEQYEVADSEGFGIRRPNVRPKFLQQWEERGQPCGEY